MVTCEQDKISVVVHRVRYSLYVSSFVVLPYFLVGNVSRSKIWSPLFGVVTLLVFLYPCCSLSERDVWGVPLLCFENILPVQVVVRHSRRIVVNQFPLVADPQALRQHSFLSLRTFWLYEISFSAWHRISLVWNPIRAFACRSERFGKQIDLWWTS